MSRHGAGGLERLEQRARGIADDVLVLRPTARTPRAYLREAVDRLAGADPGLTQLRRALVSVLGIALSVGFVEAFTSLTGALRWSDGQASAADVTAHNHAVLIVSMLIAGMVAMMAGFSVTDTTARGQLVSTLSLPLPMVAAMALGIATGRWQLLADTFLVLLLMTAVYVRRWGPRAGTWGLVAFNGGFLGFFLHAQLSVTDVGWLACDLALGAAASLLVRFTLFRPDLERTLERMRRSWEARARQLLLLGAATIEAGSPVRRSALHERLRRQSVRLNESTLMIDAQLAESVPGAAATQAQRLFDAELAVSNCARFAGAIATVVPDPRIRTLCSQGLTGLTLDPPDDESELTARLRGWEGGNERETVLVHRLAASIDRYAATHRSWRLPAPTDGDQASVDDPASAFRPAVELNAGYLPGSGPVSAAAATTPGRGLALLDGSTLPPHVRATIQIAVAGTLAIVVGGLVSTTRLSWAVLATFLAFIATANAAEQARKALFRVTGTAVGIVVGDLLVRLTGANIWSSLLIVLVALFLGIYLLRINYTFMVIGITVTMSQLYAQLGEFSWNLLVLRLAETAIGVGSVVVTVLLIVPLRPQRVLTTAVLLWFESLRDVVTGSLDRLTGETDSALYAQVRALDAAYAALEATATPLRGATFGRNSSQLTDIRSVSAAARTYARSLARQAERARPMDDAAMRAVSAQMRREAERVRERIETGAHGTFTRSGALIEIASRQVPADDPAAALALRDLTAVDGAMARLATALRMDVEDLDTSAAERAAKE